MSLVSKTEPERRPVSVLAMKLWDIAEGLEQGLDRPGEVLELLISCAAKGEPAEETWDKLHQAALKFDKGSDLAFAYEQVTQEKRIKLLPPEQQAYIFLQAARFFAEVFRDPDGAVAYVERAIGVVPTHAQALALLESLLKSSERLDRLAEHFLEASTRQETPEQAQVLLRRAFGIGVSLSRSDELVIEAGRRLLSVDPTDEAVRDDVMRRLIALGRHPEVVELLEQALAREPAPSDEEAKLLREQLVDLCFTVLGSPERALTHLEGILSIDPSHEMGRASARGLLEDKRLMLRAAAALSDAYERAGDLPLAIEMLSFELQNVRGPRRIEVQRRLGILRQDVLGDPAGALELLAPVVAGDPGDDALRRRMVELSVSLGRPEQAARLLARALQTHRDPQVRARVGVDVGNVYLTSGDVKRAQAQFQKVLEEGQDDDASLQAARRLVSLSADDGDLPRLANVLETVVRLEPEKEARQAAARRLALLADGELSDPVRAILAWRALIGSPWTDEALTRLEALCQQTGDNAALAEVLSFRAERSKDPEKARDLALRALELRAARARQPEEAIEACSAFLQRFGPSREVHQRLLPLLEETGRYAELADVLAREIELSAREDAPRLFLRLAQTRLQRLRDAPGALDALERGLRVDPTHAPSRAAAERLLGTEETRAAAAAILEPLYRASGDAPAGLLRVLETRIDSAATPGDRLAAAAEAVVLCETALADPDRGLEIACRALSEALAELPEAVGEWIARARESAEKATDPARRATLLLEVLKDRDVASLELCELARMTGEALAASGDIAGAVRALRRALSFQPGSHELLQRIDELLAQQGTPEERLGLYEAALARESGPARRRELLLAMARLRRLELDDPRGAIEILKGALADDPGHDSAHEALLEALRQIEDHAGVTAELSRVLPRLTGERLGRALFWLADAAEQLGEPQVALTRYRSLLEQYDLDAESLARVERLAINQEDAETLCVVLERTLAVREEPAQRAELLERLGDALSKVRDDTEGAVRAWLESARLSRGPVVDLPRARRLYERVLRAEPQNREAAQTLVELSAQEGDWAGLRLAFDVLLGAGDESDVVDTALGLRQRLEGEENLAELAKLLDRVLEHGLSPPRARQVSLEKAELLAKLPGGADAAAPILKKLVSEAIDDQKPYVQAFSAFLSESPKTAARTKDRRWLYGFRAKHSGDPVSVLLEWARWEARDLENPKGAIEIYQRVVEHDAELTDAWTELAEMQVLEGNAEGAIQSLEALRERVDPDAQVSLDLKRARLLIEHLGHATEALALVRPVLKKEPSNTEALRIVHRALSLPDTRAEAAELLEGVAGSSEDPARRADVIEALLAVSAEAPELAEARSRWLTQLLETKADQPEEAQKIALRGAEAAPGEEGLWKSAEELARRLNDPQPVIEAYERALERSMAADVASMVGRRMVDFHEEWFDEPERVIVLLQRVVAQSPSAQWAFDRLKLAFNSSRRWGDLFALYDARLTLATEGAQRIEVLREASMAARDFAGDAERAMAYLEALNRESPGDSRVEGSLERLYERHGRKRPLIDLLSVRLGEASDDDWAELAPRIASLWLDLGEPREPLELAQRLLEETDRSLEAVQLLERLLTLPAAKNHEPGPSGSPLTQSSALLRAYYQAAGSVEDVVRMLELDESQTDEVDQKRTLLEEIVRLRRAKLKDDAGAFETLARLVLLAPDEPAYRAELSELAHGLSHFARQVEILVTASEVGVDAGVAAGLLNEAAEVRRDALSDARGSIELFTRVLALTGVPRATELLAARALSQMVNDAAEVSERVRILERLAELETDPGSRRQALGEAAELSFGVLKDVPRAVAAYRRRLSDDNADLEALNGLCLALEHAREIDQLISALEARALLVEPAQARADRVRVAALHADVKGDAAAAIDAWIRVRERHGPDPETFSALRGLYLSEQRFSELAELVFAEIERSPDPGRRQELQIELGGLHEHSTGDRRRAVEAYVAGEDWDAAMRVVASAEPGSDAGVSVTERLLELVTQSWAASGRDAESVVGRASDWTLTELSRRLLELERYPEIVDRLLWGSQLPFSSNKRRELRREAACLSSDRLREATQAIDLFQGLIAEDPADDVARACVTRLALLLDENHRLPELVELWEGQARARVGAGDVVGGQALFARAGELCEERLEDQEWALRAYSEGAALDGEVCLEALARIHEGRGELELAADALEKLSAQSSGEVLGERALRLSTIHAALGRHARARQALEKALPRVPDGAALRARLSVLYRDAGDFTALARLIEEEAARAEDPKARLSLLREAAALHLTRRGEPAPAVPLLTQAVELAPEDSTLRLDLAKALFQCQSYAEAARVLRDQVARYGTRRPKDRALVHHELARVLLAAGQRDEALEELGTASRIDPAHPKILEMLARTALDAGELDRAESMYQALLLVAGGDAAAEISKSEALVALGEIAERRGDEARAAEFVRSALDKALEDPFDAQLLERSLRSRGKVELLAQVLELRLAQGLAPPEALRTLADLAELKLSQPGAREETRAELAERAVATERDLFREKSKDDASWSALGRVYEVLGDAAGSTRVLERRVELSGRSSRPPPDPDLYYRLVEVRLDAGTAESRAQALALLSRALDAAPSFERASVLLRQGFPQGADDPKAARLLERIARATSDPAALLEALVQRITLGDGDLALVREGVALGQELPEPRSVEPLLVAALEQERFDGVPADAAWLRLQLSGLRQTAGDVAGALDLDEQAAGFLEVDESRRLLLEVADKASAMGDLERVVRVLRALNEREPSDREVWEKLRDAYRASEQAERLVELLESTALLLDEPPEVAELRLEQVEVLLKKLGRVDDAVGLLKDILGDDPSHSAAATRLAELLEAEGRDDDLAELLAVQVDAARNREDVQALSAYSVRLALLFERQGRVDEALEACRTGLDWDARHHQLLTVQFKLAESSGDPLQVAEALESLLRGNPGAEAPALAHRLARARRDLGDDAGAEQALELGFEACPSDAELRELLFTRFQQEGNAARVAWVLELSMPEHPEDPELLERLIAAERAAGELDRALAELDRFMKTQPVDASLYRTRAGLLADLGRELDAVGALEEAHELDPSVGEELIQAMERALQTISGEDAQRVLLRLVDVLESSGNAEAARERLAELHQNDPSNQAILARLAALDAGLGQLDQAVDELSRLAELAEGAGLVQVALDLAEISAKLGRMEPARGVVTRALQIDPENGLLRERLRDVLEAAGAHGELAELLHDQASQSKDAQEHKDLLLKVCELHLMPGGSPSEALRILEELKQEHPDDLMCSVLLARAYARSGRNEDALGLLQAIVDRQRGRRVKGLSSVHEEMADIHLEEGFLSDALPAMQRAFEAEGRNARLAMRLGRLALECEEAELAQRAFRAVAIMKGADLDGPDGARSQTKADANYELARLAHQAGDVRKTRVLVSKALSEQADHAGARELLESLEKR